MAEVAASIVGLAAFGAQCANGVIELKQILRSIRDAPREVTRLLDDIILLQQILQDLEQRHNAFAFFSPPNVVWEATRRQCETAAEDVKDVCSELLSMIRSNRTRGSIRAIFKKDVVARTQERLNSIKLDLLLAQSAYDDARMSAFMQQANFHGIIPATHYLQSPQPDEFHPSADVSTSTGEPPATLKSNSYSTAVTQQIHTDVVSRRDQSQYERMRERDEQTTEYTIGGRWIGMVFKVRLHKAYYDWGLNVTRYNVLPLNAEVFQVVLRGDVAGLQRLLDNHQASIHDVNPHGDGLLEYALNVEHDQDWMLHLTPIPRLSMFRFLLSGSLRPSLQTVKRFWRSRLLDADGSMSIPWEEASRILMSHSNNLLIEDPASYLHLSGPARHEPCLSQLLSAVYPPYRTRPLSERANALRHFLRYKRDSSRLASTLLGYESWNPETMSLLDTRTCWTLLSFIASTLACCNDIEGWLDHLRLLVKHGIGPMLVQNVDLSDHYGSPLCSYVAVTALDWRDSWDRFEQSARSACLSWLQHLANAGLDLELYGKSESRLLAADRFQDVWQRRESHPAIGLSRPILAFSYGPAVSDWCLWLDCPYDQWAGDFWLMLEQESTPLVPGAWIDEDEEEAAQLRSESGQCKSLATSRRKRRRYLRFMQISDDYARHWLGPSWESSAHINGKLRDGSMYGKNWRTWPPLVADIERLGIYEREQLAFTEQYCSVCDELKPLLEYYGCRPTTAGGIRAGMCHGGDNEALQNKSEI